jgi:hypothetical protein
MDFRLSNFLDEEWNAIELDMTTIQENEVVG